MAQVRCNQDNVYNSLPEFMDFILFGKTILVVNKKFGLFLANQLRKRDKVHPKSTSKWSQGQALCLGQPV